jgi:hypothetical protein
MGPSERLRGIGTARGGGAGSRPEHLRGGGYDIDHIADFKGKFRAATRKVPGFPGARRKKIYRNFFGSGHELPRPSLELIG